MRGPSADLRHDFPMQDDHLGSLIAVLPKTRFLPFGKREGEIGLYERGLRNRVETISTDACETFTYQTDAGPGPDGFFSRLLAGSLRQDAVTSIAVTPGGFHRVEAVAPAAGIKFSRIWDNDAIARFFGDVLVVFTTQMGNRFRGLLQGGGTVYWEGLTLHQSELVTRSASIPLHTVRGAGFVGGAFCLWNDTQEQKPATLISMNHPNAYPFAWALWHQLGDSATGGL